VSGTSVAIGCVVAGLAVLAVLLAGNPGISIGDGGWVILAGITVSSAFQVYLGRREAGRPDSATWGLATGAGLALSIAAVWVTSLLLRPLAEASPAVSGNPVPIAVLAWLLLSLGVVIWARGRQRRTTAAVLAASMGAILAGMAGLRAGETWTPVAVVVLLVGLGVFMAAVLPGYQARFGGRATQAAQPVIAPGPQVRNPARPAGTAAPQGRTPEQKSAPRSIKRKRPKGIR